MKALTRTSISVLSCSLETELSFKRAAQSISDLGDLQIMLAVLLRPSLFVEKLGSLKMELYLECLSGAALGALKGLSSGVGLRFLTMSPFLNRYY